MGLVLILQVFWKSYQFFPVILLTKSDFSFRLSLGSLYWGQYGIYRAAFQGWKIVKKHDDHIPSPCLLRRGNSFYSSTFGCFLCLTIFLAYVSQLGHCKNCYSPDYHGVFTRWQHSPPISPCWNWHRSCKVNMPTIFFLVIMWPCNIHVRHYTIFKKTVGQKYMNTMVHNVFFSKHIKPPKNFCGQNFLWSAWLIGIFAF